MVTAPSHAPLTQNPASALVTRPYGQDPKGPTLGQANASLLTRIWVLPRVTDARGRRD